MQDWSAARPTGFLIHVQTLAAAFPRVQRCGAATQRSQGSQRFPRALTAHGTAGYAADHPFRPQRSVALPARYAGLPGLPPATDASRWATNGCCDECKGSSRRPRDNPRHPRDKPRYPRATLVYSWLPQGHPKDAPHATIAIQRQQPRSSLAFVAFLPSTPSGFPPILPAAVTATTPDDTVRLTRRLRRQAISSRGCVTTRSGAAGVCGTAASALAPPHPENFRALRGADATCRQLGRNLTHLAKKACQPARNSI